MASCDAPSFQYISKSARRRMRLRRTAILKSKMHSSLLLSAFRGENLSNLDPNATVFIPTGTPIQHSDVPVDATHMLACLTSPCVARLPSETQSAESLPTLPQSNAIIGTQTTTSNLRLSAGLSSEVPFHCSVCWEGLPVFSVSAEGSLCRRCNDVFATTRTSNSNAELGALKHVIDQLQTTSVKKVEFYESCKILLVYPAASNNVLRLCNGKICPSSLDISELSKFRWCLISTSPGLSLVTIPS